MGVQSYTINELIELLSNGELEKFRFTDYYAVTYLNYDADDTEVLFELKDGKITDKLVNFSVMVLENLDKYIKDAHLWLENIQADKMYADAFELGFELYGIAFGKFEYGIIGAGSVVTKDVPDYAVAVGNPAKVIRILDKERFEQE